MMMKICALFAVVLAEATASFDVESYKRHVPTFPSKALRELRMNHRNLVEGEISEACGEALYAMEDIDALNAAEETKAAEFEALVTVDPESVCSVNLEAAPIGIDCTYDMNDLPSHGDYVTACGNAGGDLVNFGFSLQCQDPEFTLSVDFSGDTCLPTVCTDEEYNIIVEAIEDIIAAEITAGLEGTTAECQVDATGVE